MWNEKPLSSVKGDDLKLKGHGFKSWCQIQNGKKQKQIMLVKWWKHNPKNFSCFLSLKCFFFKLIGKFYQLSILLIFSRWRAMLLRAKSSSSLTPTICRISAMTKNQRIRTKQKVIKRASRTHNNWMLGATI